MAIYFTAEGRFIYKIITAEGRYNYKRVTNNFTAEGRYNYKRVTNNFTAEGCYIALQAWARDIQDFLADFLELTLWVLSWLCQMKWCNSWTKGRQKNCLGHITTRSIFWQTQILDYTLCTEFEKLWINTTRKPRPRQQKQPVLRVYRKLPLCAFQRKLREARQDKWFQLLTRGFSSLGGVWSAKRSNAVWCVSQLNRF